MNNRNKNFKPNSRRNGVYDGKILFVSRDVSGNLKKEDIFNIEIEIKKVNLNTQIFDDYNLLLENSVSSITLNISSKDGKFSKSDQLLGINTNSRIKFNTDDARKYAIKWVDVNEKQFLEVKVIGYDEVAVGLLEYQINTNQDTDDIDL
jgi:hypothetical protein